LCADCDDHIYELSGWGQAPHHEYTWNENATFDERVADDQARRRAMTTSNSGTASSLTMETFRAAMRSLDDIGREAARNIGRVQFDNQYDQRIIGVARESALAGELVDVSLGPMGAGLERGQFQVTCSRCGRVVERLESWQDVYRRAVVFRAECHGHQVTAIVTERVLMEGPLDEIVRYLENQLNPGRLDAAANAERNDDADS
jgi:hypothetical protein